MILKHRQIEEEAPQGGGGGAPPAGPTPEQLEIQRLRTALAQKPAAAQNQPAAPDKKQLETAFWGDPLGMSTAIATAAAQQATMNGPGMDTLIEVAKGKVREEDPEVFDKYYGEIEQQLINAGLTHQFRTNVNVWRNAFNIVRGQHVKEIIDMKKTSAGAPAVHTGKGGDGPAGAGPAAVPATAKVKLSDDERLFARNLGLSDESYAHGKEIIEKQHGREKSPWDDAITTDSSKPTSRGRSGKQAA